MRGKVFVFCLFAVLSATLLLGQPQWVFNSMDEDPFWNGQIDREDEIESNVVLSYVSDPVLFGDGAMRLDWGATHDQSWGGGSYLRHIHLDSVGTYDWSDYDSIIVWYLVENPSTLPGAVHLRFNLGDVSDSETINTEDFADMEYWYSFHYILDDEGDWTKLAIPLADVRVDPNDNGFDRTGWHGIDGNDQLDLDMIRGFQFEFSISANEGDVALGTIVLDNMILTNTAGDTAVLVDMDEDPYWNGQRDLYEEQASNIYLSYVSDPVFNGEGAMWLDWGVTNDQSWGGGSYLNHVHWDSLGAYDWSEYDTIAFWYYNETPSSLPGAVHIRFNLGEVSDAESFNVTSFGDMEYWYSFHYILDDEPGWNKVALPLADVRVDPNGNGFERTDWYGIDGNDQLDLDVIKGFQFEFSISANEGDVALGTIILDELVLYSGEYTHVERIPLHTPAGFQLAQNYPNPFNGRTAIDYSLANSQDVLLKLFDVTGREIRTLVNGRMPAGKHTTYLNASDFPSGVYVYKLLVGDDSQTQRMILMK